MDLFAPDGARPTSREGALARKSDLILSNQTLRVLRAHEHWARACEGASPQGRRIFYLSYRPPPEEAGPERTFDLSADSIAMRWRAGLPTCGKHCASLPRLKANRL